jgi:hypothetical protein
LFAAHSGIIGIIGINGSDVREARQGKTCSTELYFHAALLLVQF